MVAKSDSRYSGPLYRYWATLSCALTPLSRSATATPLARRSKSLQETRRFPWTRAVASGRRSETASQASAKFQSLIFAAYAAACGPRPSRGRPSGTGGGAPLARGAPRPDAASARRVRVRRPSLARALGLGRRPRLPVGHRRRAPPGGRPPSIQPDRDRLGRAHHHPRRDRGAEAAIPLAPARR